MKIILCDGELTACYFCPRCAHVTGFVLVVLIEGSCCVLNGIHHCTVGFVKAHIQGCCVNLNFFSLNSVRCV